MTEPAHLTEVATRVGVDVSAAIAAARLIAEDRSQPFDLVADAIAAQLDAGVGLDAAADAVRDVPSP